MTAANEKYKQNDCNPTPTVKFNSNQLAIFHGHQLISNEFNCNSSTSWQTYNNQAAAVAAAAARVGCASSSRQITNNKKIKTLGVRRLFCLSWFMKWAPQDYELVVHRKGPVEEQVGSFCWIHGLLFNTVPSEKERKKRKGRKKKIDFSYELPIQQ